MGLDKDSSSDTKLEETEEEALVCEVVSKMTMIWWINTQNTLKKCLDQGT